MSAVALPQLDVTSTRNYSLTFIDVLHELREEFHRSGRYDDSNVKLDEITKLIFLKLGEAQGRFSLSTEWLNKFSLNHYGIEGQYARALREVFTNFASDPIAINPDGTNIFGGNPYLNIQPTENDFALHLIKALDKISLFDVSKGEYTVSFDILNEAFGHFVRENFRSNKDDAQYLTPWEIVGPTTDMVFEDIILNTFYQDRVCLGSSNQSFVICDPTCGVGSYLSRAVHRIIEIRSQHTSNVDLKDLVILGQDKVDRMVRLAKLSLSLFNNEIATIVQGNSISGNSYIDQWIGKVDLILTNPPFRAKYSINNILSKDIFSEAHINQYTILPDLHSNVRRLGSIDSEVAMVDRCFTLLGENGYLGIIMPDHFVSGSGIYSEVRKWLGDNAQLKAVVELPSVAFAQANTRAKTCFVLLQKKVNTKPRKFKIFMGICESVGYEVYLRTGAPVKVEVGQNQLLSLPKAYRDSQIIGNSADLQIISRSPSYVSIPENQVINGKWTPNFYRSERLEATNNGKDSDQIETKRLQFLADFVGKGRKKLAVDEHTRCISVLHVDNFGTINLQEVENYKPKYPGIICYPGEVLISKINPRIPRITVVPKIPYNLTCSVEFEILKPKEGLDPYMLLALLMSGLVQKQIKSLTSGTSASHNRVKSSELAMVEVPLPVKDSKLYHAMKELAAKMDYATSQLYTHRADIHTTIHKSNELLG